MGFFKRVEIIAISTPKKLERNKYSNKKAWRKVKRKKKKKKPNAPFEHVFLCLFLKIVLSLITKYNFFRIKIRVFNKLFLRTFF